MHTLEGARGPEPIAEGTDSLGRLPAAYGQGTGVRSAPGLGSQPTTPLTSSQPGSVGSKKHGRTRRGATNETTVNT